MSPGSILVELLPSSRLARETKVVIGPGGIRYVPLFCANCGKDGGYVIESDWDQVKNFGFYLCDPCSVKWAPLTNTCKSPDEVFWQKVHEAQMNAFGRELEPWEIVAALQDDKHILTKLSRERNITP